MRAVPGRVVGAYLVRQEDDGVGAGGVLLADDVDVLHGLDRRALAELRCGAQVGVSPVDTGVDDADADPAAVVPERRVGPDLVRVDGLHRLVVEELERTVGVDAAHAGEVAQQAHQRRVDRHRGRRHVVEAVHAQGE